MFRSSTCALALFSLPAAAQNLITSDMFAPICTEVVGVSPLFPGPAGAPLGAYPHMFPLPPMPVPAGDVTINNATGQIWYTNGVLIAAMPHPAYSVVPPIPPLPAPPIGGPITGMTYSAAAGLLWLTDGVVIAGAFPIPGTPIAVPPFPMAFPHPPFTGLDWDPITGTFWAVTIGGLRFNFTVAGALIAPPLPPIVPLPGPATGITIDKSGMTTGIFPRSIYIIGGGMMQDVSTGVVRPTFGPGMETGITYHAAPSIMPPGPPCPCPSFAYGQVLTGPMVTGNPAFGINLVGLPPGNIVIYAFDFAGFDPLFPLVNGVGCPFGLNFPTAIGFGGLASPLGVASFPLSLVGVPAGIRFYMQYVTVCPADPVLGIVITPLYQVQTSAP